MLEEWDQERGTYLYFLAYANITKQWEILTCELHEESRMKNEDWSPRIQEMNDQMIKCVTRDNDSVAFNWKMDFTFVKWISICICEGKGRISCEYAVREWDK